MGGACDTYGGGERCVQGFGGETLCKGPLARPKHRCKNDIKVDLREVGWENMDWIDVTGGGRL